MHPPTLIIMQVKKPRIREFMYIKTMNTWELHHRRTGKAKERDERRDSSSKTKRWSLLVLTYENV